MVKGSVLYTIVPPHPGFITHTVNTAAKLAGLTPFNSFRAR